MLVKLLLVTVLAVSVFGKSKENEEARKRRKDRKPGKTISLEENGDVDITIMLKKKL